MLALSFLSNSLSRSRWWTCACETWIQFTQQKSNGGRACARHGFNSLSRSRMVDMRVQDMDSIHSAEVEWLTCVCETCGCGKFSQRKSNRCSTGCDLGSGGNNISWTFYSLPPRSGFTHWSVRQQFREKSHLKKGLNLIHTMYLAMQTFNALSNVIWFCKKEKKDSEFVITIEYEYEVII